MADKVEINRTEKKILEYVTHCETISFSRPPTQTIVNAKSKICICNYRYIAHKWLVLAVFFLHFCCIFRIARVAMVIVCTVV